jgi:hypothetical protein
LLLRLPPSRQIQPGSEVRRAEPAEPHSLEIGEIFALHHQQVSVWVRRLGGPGIEVDDAVQEVFLIALRRLHEFKGRERLIVWLYRITEFRGARPRSSKRPTYPHPGRCPPSRWPRTEPAA